MEENTEEEHYDDLFHLGCTSKTIAIVIHLSQDPPLPETLANLKLNYFRLQAIATRLKIELPDQPDEDKTAACERKQFFYDQLVYVDECIRRKRKKHKDIFCSGMMVESFITGLLLCEPGNQAVLGSNFLDLKKIRKPCEEGLQAIAKENGEDISEEIAMANAWVEGKCENKDVFESVMRSQLQKKLCKLRKQPEKKRSEVDPTRIITNNY